MPSVISIEEEKNEKRHPPQRWYGVLHPNLRKPTGGFQRVRVRKRGAINPE